MTDDEIKTLLPETAPKALERWTEERYSDELGGDRILFRRESVSIVPEIMESMDPEDWEKFRRDTKRKWGAVCSCLSCGDTFTAGWCSNTARHEKGIVLRYGEDGIPFDGWEDENATTDENGYVSQFGEGELVPCPLCMTEGKLTAESTLNKGQTFSLLVMEARNIESLTTLLYWRVCRRLTRNGYETWTEPFEAIVLDENMRLRRFSHAGTGMCSGVSLYDEWKPHTTVTDPEQRRYHDAGSNGYKKVGAAVCADSIPDMSGCSGEKTGLEDYLKHSDGFNAVLYLKLWKKHPQIENMVKAGWAYAVQTGLSDAVNQCLHYGAKTDTADIPWLDFREVKPHRMLGVSKTELKAGAKLKWDGERVCAWKKYSVSVEHCDLAQYAKWLKLLTPNGMYKLIAMAEHGYYSDMTLTACSAYIAKHEQGLGVNHAIDLLIDHRTMLYRLRGNEATEEEKWPRDLRAAHDRLMEMQKQEKDNAYQEKFDAIRKRWSALEWNDGELCIVIPKCAGDLKAEGNTLRHCVGGYASAHADGKLILFVRHYRRPERSYYTLNINVTGTRPEQIQLHGYGNEFHGEHKEHRHKIPRKVLAFVETWKREVLAPVFEEVRRKEAEEKSRKTKKRKDIAA